MNTRMPEKILQTKTVACSLLLFGSLILGGCSDPALLGDGPPDDSSNLPPGTDPTNPPETVNPATTCAAGTAYVGFAGTELTAGRAVEVIGVDRGRVKPYSAFVGEYPRVLGSTPSTLAAMGPTFGRPADRWYTEPQASAISVYSAYSVAFDGCLTSGTTAAQYAAAPTAATAATECASWARKFWSRTATPDEVSACVNVAMVETVSLADAHRRWAHTCASVLTTAGFVTF